MTTSDHERIIELSVPSQPVRRRRSRLGEPTVRIEFTVIGNTNPLATHLLARQAAAVREALQWFADHPTQPGNAPDYRRTETTAP